MRTPETRRPVDSEIEHLGLGQDFQVPAAAHRLHEGAVAREAAVPVLGDIVEAGAELVLAVEVAILRQSDLAGRLTERPRHPVGVARPVDQSNSPSKP